MADHPYDGISAAVREAYKAAAPNDYAELERRVQAILDEYGDLGVMVMLDVLDRFEVPTEGDAP